MSSHICAATKPLQLSSGKSDPSTRRSIAANDRGLNHLSLNGLLHAIGLHQKHISAVHCVLVAIIVIDEDLAAGETLADRALVPAVVAALVLSELGLHFRANLKDGAISAFHLGTRLGRGAPA